MTQNTITHPDQGTVLVAVDEQTLHEIDHIAQKYGATREEIVEELLRLELTERAKVAAIH